MMIQMSGDEELENCGNGADFSENFGIQMANLGGQKKCGINCDYGVKRVRSDLGVNPTEDINTCEDPCDTLVSQSVDNTSSIANSIEKDSGQGGPSQNKCRVEKLFEPAAE